MYDAQYLSYTTQTSNRTIVGHGTQKTVFLRFFQKAGHQNTTNPIGFASKK